MVLDTCRWGVWVLFTIFFFSLETMANDDLSPRDQKKRMNNNRKKDVCACDESKYARSWASQLFAIKYVRETQNHARTINGRHARCSRLRNITMWRARNACNNNAPSHVIFYSDIHYNNYYYYYYYYLTSVPMRVKY